MLIRKKVKQFKKIKARRRNIINEEDNPLKNDLIIFFQRNCFFMLSYLNLLQSSLSNDIWVLTIFLQKIHYELDLSLLILLDLLPKSQLKIM